MDENLVKLKVTENGVGEAGPAGLVKAARRRQIQMYCTVKTLS
jgi:hypothetical protein